MQLSYRTLYCVIYCGQYSDSTVGTQTSIISNNTSFRLKHPGVLDGSDGSDGTTHPLTENYTLPVTQATGRVTKPSTWECRRQTWERLGAPRITVEQSGKNNIFGNAAGAPETHSNY
jgi:hypothetical protein